MQVKGLDIDVVDYRDNKDIHVSATYIGPHSYSICVRRLDSFTQGWNTNLIVLANFYELNQTTRIEIGPSESNTKSIDVQTEFEIFASDCAVVNPTHYSMIIPPDLEKLSRADFNQRFQTDIVVLPYNLYAVGLCEGRGFIYNEVYSHYFQIDLTIRYLLSVAKTRGVCQPFYFIVCGDDGYLESHYPAVRDRPRLVGETECVGKQRILMHAEDEFPVFHKYKYVLGQNVQIGTAYAYAVPDRYYFCLNLFNQYRSYHLGIPFLSKKSQIVYASRPRGSHFNFTKRRDIFMPQRDYFYSDAVPKTHIHVPGEIACQDMIQYKYLLDIDGWSSTWEATAWKLNSGSVILKTASGWNQWFSDKYLPWVHYVPVEDDFSNLQEQFAWCEAHQEECEAIIRRCKKLFQDVYRFSAVSDYAEGVLRTLSIDQSSLLGLNTA
jgi:hypothetical protein